MIRFVKLQLIGQLTVLITVGIGEAGAYALNRMTGSETLWYLNLKAFAFLQTSYYALSGFVDVAYSQVFVIALPISIIVVAGFLSRQRLLLALGSHQIFIYALFLLCSELVHQFVTPTVSLVNISVPMNVNFLLPLILIGASLVALVVSQFQYFVVFFDRRRRVRRTC